MIAKKKKAVTLVEISIGIVLSSLLLVGILNLLRSGVKSSTKALTNQDNMETANILMTQIESDLLSAIDIVSPDWNNQRTNGEAETTAEWKVNSGGSIVIVRYGSNATEGVTRVMTGVRDYTFAKDHLVDLSFKHFAVDTGRGENDSLIIEKHGMWVDLTVYSSNVKTEADKEKDLDAFTMRRLMVVRRPF